jgi:hypothetical protein
MTPSRTSPARSASPPASWPPNDFASRTAQRHRTEIRAYTAFRECSVADAETLTSWLADHVASIERREHRVRESYLPAAARN